MKRAWQDSSSDLNWAHRLVGWTVVLVALPLALFSWWVFLQSPSRLNELTPASGVQVWQEPVGRVVFDQAGMEKLVQTPADWTQVRWHPVTLPAFQKLGAMIDLPPDAPKLRAWFRIPIPAELSGGDTHGRLGLLGFRVQGGAWSVWADGRLIQANLSDWRIQWNVPLRVTVPLGAREMLLAVPYAEPQGFSVGSIFIGPMDVVDTAWQERNTWHLDIPRFMSVVSLLLMFISFHLAWSRPKERMFLLLGFNALGWSVSCLQWSFDVTGSDTLSIWYGSAMDSSITWSVVLGILFVFEFEGIKAPRLRLAMVLFAALSTVLTLPVWAWQKNMLIAQHYANAVVHVTGLAVVAWHIAHRPRREAVVLFLALLIFLGLGLHTLENLTNQTHPDSFYSFPIGIVVMYLAFMYAMSRRTVAALNASEQHEALLQARLAEQEQHLAQQHALLQTLEVQRHLAKQHETIMQDLHDRLGSNLTSALLQARTGVLSPQETVLLLQDLADELRHMGKSTTSDPRGLNEVLAELRQRVQHRLRHGGIELVWDVDPLIPVVAGQETSQHLRALLSEAIANVIKHAKASEIRLEARVEGEVVVIVLTDNGQGFDPDAVEHGRGLPGMRQRARAIGADVDLRSQVGQGCQLTLRLPTKK